MCFSYRNFKMRYKLSRVNNKNYKLLYSQNNVLPGRSVQDKAFNSASQYLASHVKELVSDMVNQLYCSKNSSTLSSIHTNSYFVD